MLLLLFCMVEVTLLSQKRAKQQQQQQQQLFFVTAVVFAFDSMSSLLISLHDGNQKNEECGPSFQSQKRQQRLVAEKLDEADRKGVG